MPHEAKVGQTFTLDLDLEIDLVRRRPLGQGGRYRLLRQGRRLHDRSVLRPALSPDRSGRRLRGRCRADHLCAVRSVRVTIHKPHAPIAATFADVGVTLVARAVMVEALLALGGDVGHSRAIRRPAPLPCSATAKCAVDRALIRLSNAALGLDRPARISQCLHCGETTLSPGDLLARGLADRINVRPGPRPRKEKGPRTARHRPDRL